MAYSAVPTVVTGDSWSAANHNTYLRDNLAALWPFTTAGDLAYASSATALARLAVGSHIGDIMRVNAAGNAPEWGGLVAAFGQDASTGFVGSGGSADITFDSEKFDSHGFIDISLTPKKIVFPTGLGGYYLVLACARFGVASAATGSAEIIIYHKNSADELKNDALMEYVTSNDLKVRVVSTFMIIQAAAADYISAVYSNYLGVGNATANHINIGVLRLMAL